MPRLQFGYTWWGKKWLDALIATDYSNRLPRGMRYARNGSVKSMTIDGTRIRAKVQGSRPRPYDISIDLPALKKEQQDAILNLIAQHPFILSQLSQKKLPEELYEEFRKKQLHLFPQKWSELKADCSCPDWAECCKHIAAIIYLLANKIDQDPFLIFRLRGFDLLAALPSPSSGTSDLQVNIRKTEDIIRQLQKDARPVSKKGTALADPPLLQTLDFSRIPDLGREIVSILPDTQIFCRQENVKQLLASLYNRLMRVKAAPEIDEEMGRCDAFRLLPILTDANLRVKCLVVSDDDHSFGADAAKNREFAAFLQSIPFSQLPYCDAGIRALALIERLASVLCEKGGIVPELLECTPDCFRVRFVALMAHPEVRSLVQSIIPFMPPAECSTSVKSKKGHSVLSQEETLTVLLAHFIQQKIDTALRWEELSGHPVLHMLLKGENLTLSGDITRDTAELVWLYFSRFFLARKTHIPTLTLEEADHGFRLSLGMREDAGDSLLIQMRDILRKEKHAAHRHNMLRMFGLLAEHYPPISMALMSDSASIVLSDDQCIDMLQKTLPVLTLLGIGTQLPKSLAILASPKPTLNIQKDSAQKIASYLQLADMLRFDWRIAIGDQVITEAELEKMLKTGRKLVKFRDSYVLLDPEKVRSLLDTLRHPPAPPSAAHMLHILLTGEFRGAPVRIDEKLVADIRSLFQEQPVPLPKALRATLRPYQERGFSWLYRNMRIGFGSLLADDMGLGKTLQVISLLLKMKEEKTLHPGSALVVAPTTLLTNWQKEIQKFAPSLRVAVYHGADRQLPEATYDVLLTSYGLVRSDAATFHDIKWAVTVFDEAQNVKNRSTAQSKAVKNLRSSFRIAMTGTPVENSLMEYWNITDAIHPGYLGDAPSFMKAFASPIEKERDTKVLGTFHAITKPLIIRRLKTDTSIISDLPRKVENDAFTTLTKQQAALYQSVVDSIMHDIEHSEGIERKGLVFKLMTALKQICNHPAHYQKSSFFRREESGKMDYLFPLLDTVRESHEKVLIFTQYAEMGAILQRLIQEHTGREPLFFHGGVPRKQRDEFVESFQGAAHHDVMILSLKAGGVGLNLTAANHVIHYDLWWNPAVETQATDRAFRIGQKKNVMVHRFITQGTFEEKIDAMIKRKKDLANLTVATGEKWVGKLTNEELRDIVTLSR